MAVVEPEHRALIREHGDESWLHSLPTVPVVTVANILGNILQPEKALQNDLQRAVAYRKDGKR